MRKIAYLAIDVHAKHSILGEMDSIGNFRGNQTFPTSEQNISKALKPVKAKQKYLALEYNALQTK